MLTRKNFEDLGCKFVLCSDCEKFDFTFNFQSKKENWVYVIVWQPKEDKVVICNYDTNKGIHKSIERLYLGVIKDFKTLNIIFNSVISLNG